MIDFSPIFQCLFDNAKQNAMMIMSPEGVIIQVNSAFTNAFGYTTEDLQSKHFRVLYTPEDQATKKPEIELNITHREGSGNDENYTVHKDGTPIWVTGESILIKNDSANCIVKIIHNIHAQKQLEHYLLDSSELLDSLFDSVQSGLLLVDSQMKLVKVNNVFKKMFNVTADVAEGSKINELGHTFWNDEEIKKDIRSIIVNNNSMNKEFPFIENENMRRLHIFFKMIMSENSEEKRVLLVLKEI